MALYRDENGIGPLEREIAGGIGLNTYVLTAMLRDLERRELIEREKERPRSIVVTEAGYAVLKKQQLWPERW